MARITAKDIAAKLGLSGSGFLGFERPGVSENTRSSVLETAMQMGYAWKEGLSGKLTACCFSVPTLPMPS